MYSRVNRIRACLAIVPSQEKALGELTAHAKGATTQYWKYHLMVASRPSAHSRSTSRLKKHWGLTHRITHKGPASVSPPDKLPPGLTACSLPGCLQCASPSSRETVVLKTLLLPQTAHEFVAQCFLGDCPSSPLPSFSLSSCIQVPKRVFYKLHS